MQLTSPHLTSTSTPHSSHLLCSEVAIFAAMWYNPQVYRSRGESCKNQGEGRRRGHTFQAEHLQNPAIYPSMFIIISKLDYSHSALLELLLKHPCVTCQCWKLSVLFLLLSFGHFFTFEYTRNIRLDISSRVSHLLESLVQFLEAKIMGLEMGELT